MSQLWNLRRIEGASKGIPFGIQGNPFWNLRGLEERSEGHLFFIWSLRENLQEVKGTPFGIEPKLTG